MFTLETYGAVMRVETEAERDELISKGFKLVEEVETTYDVNGESLIVEECDLNSKTVSELKAIAKERNVENYSSMKKEELVNVLSEEVV